MDSRDSTCRAPRLLRVSKTRDALVPPLRPGEGSGEGKPEETFEQQARRSSSNVPVTFSMKSRAAGALTRLRDHTSTTFSAIPAAAQTELQTLAAGDGFSGTIAGTQAVDAYDEANGTTICSVNLPVSKTGRSGMTFMINVTISVDQNDNPTTMPTDGLAASHFNTGSFVRFGGGAELQLDFAWTPEH